MKGQGNLNMHVIFDSVLMLYTNKMLSCRRETARAS